MVNLAIYKNIVRLEDSELKIAGSLTLENMVFIDRNRQVPAVMNNKGFQGGRGRWIVALSCS